MNASSVEKTGRATKAQVFSAWLVYGLLAVGHLADTHSTAIGLANGRIELNPIASALSSLVPPLASVIALKVFAAGVTIALLRKWSTLDDASEFWLPVISVGLLSFVATAFVTWRNYA